MSEKRIHITQGEFATGAGDDVVISTLLGSCVSCCIWDPFTRVGGMNHILIAESGANETAFKLSGINAMEVLINDLIKNGAIRGNLQCKAFGGARMINGLSMVGAQNAAFVTDFLQREEIPLVSQSLGGTQARNLKFWPGSGRVMLKLMTKSVPELPIQPSLPTSNDLELF